MKVSFEIKSLTSPESTKKAVKSAERKLSKVIREF
jgi:hypothetical protein